MHRSTLAFAVLSSVVALAALGSCGRHGETQPGGTGPVATPDAHDHDGDGHAGHDHDGDHGDHGDMGSHGAMVDLGTATIANFEVHCSRDEGDITAGGEIAVDVHVTGDLAPIAAVRIWYGAADAAGSIKARADIEDPKDPAHWHTHVEVPDPIPAEAAVWVELEIAGVGKRTASFGAG
ncbi:MAG: hypothetical protein KDA22_03215 [Phycisphaerales bacterium]|nr:hypothetical protein [Phycisphaerales bacterium]